MSNYHFLDEAGKPQGPVPEAEIAKLVATARQNGRELLVAKPGDKGWAPYSTSGAAPSPAPTGTQPQAVRPPQATPMRTQTAASAHPQGMAPGGVPAGAMAARQQFAAPVMVAQQPMAMPPPGFSPYPMRSTWLVSTIRVSCYVLSVLCILSTLVSLVLFIVGIAGGNASMAISGVWMLGMAPASLATALLFLWAGKVVSLLEEIVATQRH